MNIQSLRQELDNIGARHLISARRPLRTHYQSAISTYELQAENPRLYIRSHHPKTYRDWARDTDESWFADAMEEENCRGSDALAWYVSFHNADPTWGIFVPVSSLIYVAERWLPTLTRSFEEKMMLTFEALIHHEAMHYAIDRNVAGWEMVLGVPLHGRVPASVMFNGYIPEEEAIANAHKLRQIAKNHNASALRAIEHWVLNAPLGYRDAHMHKQDQAFQNGQAEVAKIYAEQAVLASNSALQNPGLIRWNGQFPVNNSINLSGCPIHLIHDLPSLGQAQNTVTLI